MSDVGGKLRQARERRGISLRQIAATTRISPVALEALERNDTARLPGGIFSRAFVRSYAAEVGLDPEATVREFVQQVGDESPSAVVQASRVPEEESQFESAQRIAGVMLRLALISTPIVIGILYFTLRGRPPGSTRAPDGAGETETSVPVTPSARAPSAPAPSPIVQPTTARTVDTARPAAAVKQAFRVELHPTGDCWVSMTADGRQVLSRLMKAGERQTVEVQSEAVIEVGDAGAFAYSVNGREAAPAGSSGQLRSIRLTAADVAQPLR